MSKDRSVPPPKSKKRKVKRVVAVAQPPTPTRKLAPPIRPTVPSKPIPTVVQPVRPMPAPVVPGPAAAISWSLNLEAALYGLFTLIALAVRLYDLGRFPLQEIEGVRAWLAWSLYRGLPEATLAGQPPLTVFGAYLAFLLFGASDTTVRLLPALAGSISVIIPYFLRRDLGRTAALVASAILALSPSLVFVSRSVDGGAVVVTGALVLLACALHYRRTEDRRAIYLAAVTLGFMFAADRTAGPTAVILGIFALLAWRRSEQEREVPLQALRLGALVFVVTAVVVGTGFLLQPQGIQSALIDPLTAWVSQGPSGSLAQRLSFYLRVLVAYEPLVVLFATIGVVAMLFTWLVGWQRRRIEEKLEEVALADSETEPLPVESASDLDLSPLLVWWSVASMIVYILLGDQSPATVAALVLPLVLLAASFIGRMLEAQQVTRSGKEITILAFIFILIAFAFVPWINPPNLFGGRFTSLERRIQSLTTVLLAVLILGMAALAAWYAYKLRVRGTLLAMGLALGLALSIYTIHSTCQLNHVTRPDATEPLLQKTTALDVRLLLEDVRAVSRRQGDDTIAISLDDRLGQPLRWYLRQFLNVSIVRVGQTTKTPVIIALAEAKDILSRSLGRDYVSQRYRLRSSWTTNVPLGRWLRWAHVREPISPPKGEDIIAFYKLPQ